MRGVKFSPKVSEACDGLMLPGRSLSNLTALHVARYFATRGADGAANTETTAIDDDDFQEEKKNCSKHEYKRACQVAFVSAETHYSFEKAVSLIGLGREYLIKVPTKQNGEMDVEQFDLLMTQMENKNLGTKREFHSLLVSRLAVPFVGLFTIWKQLLEFVSSMKRG
jgi:glutamate/tyrosine decarboxylase-like PLP-dependent enzyme